MSQRGAVAFCRAVTKYDDPGADVPVDEIVRTPHLIAARLNIDERERERESPVPESQMLDFFVRDEAICAARPGRCNGLLSVVEALPRRPCPIVQGTSVID